MQLKRIHHVHEVSEKITFSVLSVKKNSLKLRLPKSCNNQ